MTNFIEDIQKKVAQVDFFDEREFLGCSEADISVLEKAHPNSIKLPVIYKEFLSFAGNKFVYMQPASSFFYKNMLSFTLNEFPLFLNRDEFSSVFFVNSKEEKLFPENGFIFYMHHGYQFRFFLCDDERDPSVYFFSDDPKLLDYKRVNSKLSEEIISFIDEFLDIHKKKLENTPKIQKALNVFKVELLDIIDLISKNARYDETPCIKRLQQDYKDVYRILYDLYIQPENTINRISSYLEEYVLSSTYQDSSNSLYKELVPKAKDLKTRFELEILSQLV